MGDIKHILIVDDDVELLEMLRLPLTHQGYQVSVADKLAKAESVLKGHLPVSLILNAWPEKISVSTIGRALAKINYTRKKRVMSIKNEMNSNAKNL